MAVIHLALIVLALVCLLAAAFEVKGQRFNLTAAGLFLWLLATLVGS